MMRQVKIAKPGHSLVIIIQIVLWYEEGFRIDCIIASFGNEVYPYVC